MPVTVTYGLVGLWEIPVRTVIQHGPKGKRVAAFAIDWPGWGRGAKTPDEAVELLEAYSDRYRRVARYAGLESEFATAGELAILEDHVGVGSTDFWGIHSRRPRPSRDRCPRTSWSASWHCSRRRGALAGMQG